MKNKDKLAESVTPCAAAKAHAAKISAEAKVRETCLEHFHSCPTEYGLCAWCKRYWNRARRENSGYKLTDEEFEATRHDGSSHGCCPTCAVKLKKYGTIAKRKAELCNIAKVGIAELVKDGAKAIRAKARKLDLIAHLREVIRGDFRYAIGDVDEATEIEEVIESIKKELLA